MSKQTPNEAEVNYRYVGSATKSIHRSVKQASRDLQSDYEKILRTYTEKGGFSSRQEALDYLNGHVQPEGYQALVERARKLPEPYRTQELTKLSTDAYKFRMSRAKACDIAQGYHARELQDSIRRDLGQAKAKTAVTAAEQSLFNAQKTAGTGIGFDLPNTKQIRRIAYGTSTERKIKLFSDNEMKGIREVMDAGILSGRSWDDVAKQCEAHTDKDFYKVRRLVRTEMAQASVDAEIAELEELGYEQYEVHCTLDEVTCEICGQYDGKVFKVSDTANLPTYHPNCRCYITPVTDGKGTRSARDAKGKSVKVPAGMRYPEWREKYAPELKVQHKKFDTIQPISNDSTVTAGKSEKGIYNPVYTIDRGVVSGDDPFPEVSQKAWINMSEQTREKTFVNMVSTFKRVLRSGTILSKPSVPRDQTSEMRRDLEIKVKNKTVSRRQIDSIRIYTGNAAKEYINPTLYNTEYVAKQSAKSEKVPEALRNSQIFKDIDFVIAQGENKDTLILHKGFRENPFPWSIDDLEKHIGEVWINEGYMSMTTKPRIAKNFARGGIISTVIVPPSKGKVVNISQYSMKPNQSEVLGQRQSGFILKKVYRTNEGCQILMEMVE